MGYQDLAYAIVEQAVEDYRLERNNPRKLNKIKKFFTSKWCDCLLKDTSFDGKEILKRLESETK